MLSAQAMRSDPETMFPPFLRMTLAPSFKHHSRLYQRKPAAISHLVAKLEVVGSNSVYVESFDGDLQSILFIRVGNES